MLWGQRDDPLLELAMELERVVLVADPPDGKLMRCKRLQARGPLLLRVAFAIRHLWNGSQRSGSFVAAKCALFEPLCF